MMRQGDLLLGYIQSIIFTSYTSSILTTKISESAFSFSDFSLLADQISATGIQVMYVYTYKHKQKNLPGVQIAGD